MLTRALRGSSRTCLPDSPILRKPRFGIDALGALGPAATTACFLSRAFELRKESSAFSVKGERCSLLMAVGIDNTNGELPQFQYGAKEKGSTFFSRQLVQALVWCFPASWISKGGLVVSIRYGSSPDLLYLSVPNMMTSFFHEFA